MIRKIRFYYLLFLAVLKKEWKKVSLGGSVVIVILLTILSLAPFFYTRVIGTYNKVAKPTYIEAVVGKPTTFNPVLSKTELEKQINSLVFRSLMKVSGDGSIVPDLAERVRIKSQTEYEFDLKQNIYWQDGQKFTASDVVYTVETAQNPVYESDLEANFHDVEVKKINDYTVSFKLKEAFAPFLTATTIGIIPKHIPLNNYRPVGIGSFRFVDVKASEVTLEGKQNKIRFKFYPTQAEATTALKLGEVHGLNLGNTIEAGKSYNIAVKPLPMRLVTAFFNVRTAIFSEKEKALRQTLATAVNKESLVKSSGGLIGQVAFNSMPLFNTIQKDTKEKYPYNPEKAANSLTSLGWVLQPDGKRAKDNQKLAFSITTVEDPQLEEVAKKLKASWEAVGASISTKVVSATSFKNSVVPNRSFDVLLTSQILNPDPDQYVLWHSTQTQGANVSGIAQAKLDKLLEDGRKSSEIAVRTDKYQEFTRLLLDESPAVFLYYTNYIWAYSKRISNVNLQEFLEPQSRFANADSWKIERPIW